MSDNKNLTWEEIQTSFVDSMSPRDKTYRSKIPGGWLVRYAYIGGAGKTASAIIFIADVKSEWTFDKGKDLWQAVDTKRSPNDDLKIYRMSVPGGWIVREGYFVSSRQSNELKIGHLSLSMTFVTDKKHEWAIAKAEEDKQPVADNGNIIETPDNTVPHTFGGSDF